MRSRALGFLLLILLWSHSSRAAVEIQNVGVDASLGFELQGNYVAIRTSEARSGNVDLNGDGDSLDFVLQVLDLSTGIVRNTGLEASGGFRMAGPHIAFTVLESRQGATDLNGDGDTTDLVQHLYDAATGTVVNLGLAAGTFAIDDDILAFTVVESAQGGADLDGDGDAKDNVLHVYRLASGTLVNVGRDAGGGFVVAGERVAFAVSETSDGGLDRNGDADVTDLVLHLYNAGSGALTNLHLATLSNQLQMNDDYLAFVVRENLQGNADRNGDGDALDNVLTVYDLAGGTTTNLGRAVTSFQLVDATIAFAQPEAGQGASDANGDGDTADDVMQYYDVAGHAFTNLSFAVDGFQLDGQHLAFGVREFRQASTDLNGDGDTSDLVLHLHDLGTGTTVNLGYDTTLGFKLDGDMLLAFGVWEPAQGAGDLNGDGDVSDYALHVFDIVSGTVINLEVDPSGGFQSFQLDGKFLSFGVQELAQGATDLNMDGDASDIVLHFFDASTGVVTNLGHDVTAGHQVDGGHIAFAVTESRQGMTDLNGDGDAGDVVLHVADLTPESAREMIEALIAHVRSLGLHRGTERHLVQMLELALRAFDDGQPCRAAAWLRVFQLSLRAQTAKKVESADGASLMEEAAAIIAVLKAADESHDCHQRFHRLCVRGAGWHHGHFNQLNHRHHH